MGHRAPSERTPVNSGVLSRNTDLRVVHQHEEQQKFLAKHGKELEAIAKHEREALAHKHGEHLNPYIAPKVPTSALSIIVGLSGCLVLIYALFFAVAPGVLLPLAAAMIGFPALSQTLDS